MTGKPGAVLDAAAGRAVPRPVTLWRLEWLRLVRTPRAVSLLAVFVAIGAAIGAASARRGDAAAPPLARSRSIKRSSKRGATGVMVASANAGRSVKSGALPASVTKRTASP